MFLTTTEVRRIALSYLDVDCSKISTSRASKLFKQYLGSLPKDIGDIWFDICCLGDTMPEKEKSLHGFKRYILSHYWLWTYQRNSQMCAFTFKICERNCRGEPVRRWVKRIAALKKWKITWDDSIDDPSGPVFVLTVDGIDFRMNEPKHPTLPRDSKQCSHKHKHACARYEVGVSVFKPKICWISGPYKGGMPDKEVIKKSGLLDKVPEGKLVIADGGYTIKAKELRAKLALPNTTDPKELYNFKSRARLRQETVNSRLTNFGCLSTHSFRHGYDYHKDVFEAVCVICQYQMDNGAEPYAV
jgi:hypothetical protein